MTSAFSRQNQFDTHMIKKINKIKKSYKYFTKYNFNNNIIKMMI